MNYQDNTYITTQDLLFQGVLYDIKKSRVSLQPIFEAFTNALEAIKIKEELNNGFKGEILIKINATETTTESPEFNNLSLADNGIGFNEKEFKRFNIFKDFTKGFKNLGSGRIQFTHYFDNTIIKSTFNEDEKYFEREFIVSKKESFLKNNAIVYNNYCKETSSTETGTIVTFNTLLENSNIYDNLNERILKNELLERYIHYFCYNKKHLPKIEIKYYVQSKIKGETTIVQNDIPNINKKDILKLPYSKISFDGKSIEKTDKIQDFYIDSFKVRKEILKSNKLDLVSKGEIIEESGVLLKNLAEGDNIDGYRYLFLVSSNYIDERDTNVRGILNIPTKESYSKNLNLFTVEEILIEDIQEGIDISIDKMYPEILEVKQIHNAQFEKLKEMFLLDDETAKGVSISINDNESKILEKFYEAEAKKTASIDANIKVSFDKLNDLDTTSDTYFDELQKEVEKLVKVIPQQNKVSLTLYVARRKLVLELFDKIIKKQLSVQSNQERNIDEKLLHNLIFQQSASNPEDSDLWLVNEDFIYFKGTSEDKLKDININGIKLLRDNLTAAEEEFRISLGEDRYAKRPDILLFPEEGKCIIIEFKNPGINVSEHLTQINNYATLIWNFSRPEFRFTSFYGYLIGESINAIDVRSHDGDFREAYQFDYLFRPNKLIAGVFVKPDAALYTEVIKYSTLLKRALRRNEIFIIKLTKVSKS
jgi:hypothetical protein